MMVPCAPPLTLDNLAEPQLIFQLFMEGNNSILVPELLWD